MGGFTSLCSQLNLHPHHEEEFVHRSLKRLQASKALSNIVAFPNKIGRFTYNAQNDLVTSMNEAERQIWGWEEGKDLHYSDVLASVDDPTSFMEQTIGHNYSHIITLPIQLNNGRILKEELTYHFHPEDYEGRSLIEITGTTLLIKAA